MTFELVQKTLTGQTIRKTQDDLALFNKIVNDSWSNHKIYLCLKHKQTFFRDNDTGIGMCWKCKDIIKPNDKKAIEDINGLRLIPVYPLQHWQTSEVMVIQKHFESLEKEEVNNMAWEEKKGMPTKEWEKKGEEIIGKVIDKQENIGENSSTLYTIQQENGEKIGIWESGFLKVPMADIKIGDKIKIVYEGLGKAKQKGFNPPKLFKVFVDK
jgi:hypothetical protein